MREVSSAKIRGCMPISDYGEIGDCHSAAPVAGDRSIDFYCLPHFNSSAIFGRMLDQEGEAKMTDLMSVNVSFAGYRTGKESREAAVIAVHPGTGAVPADG